MEPSVPAAQVSTPRPPAGPTQGMRKLRESCISCSKSKVRCDKGKPTCGRCIRRGLPCEYMVSRRTGRTRVIGVERPVTTTDASSRGGPTALHGGLCAPESSLSVSLPATHTPPIPAPLQTPPSESELWNAIFSPSASNSTDISSLLSVSPDFGDLFACLSPSLDNANPNPDSMDTDIGDLSVADPSLMQGLPAEAQLPDHAPSTPVNTNADKGGPCCLAICLDILLRLFPNARAGCDRPGSQESPGPSKLSTIESVIEDNKAILDTVQTVLSCRCADDEYVATLVSLIVFKVLGWYVAVARDRSGTATGPGGGHGDLSWITPCSPGQHSPRPSPASFEEQVVHLPTVVGGYCVDGHHQSRMAAQLVLSELYRVQRLVTLVGRRLETIRARSTDGTAPISSTTLQHLEDDLRKRLRAVSSETISILRSA